MFHEIYIQNIIIFDIIKFWKLNFLEKMFVCNEEKNHKYTFNIFIRHTNFRNPPTTRMTIDIFPPLLIYSFQQKKWDFSREIMIRGARQPENLFKFAVLVCDNVLCSPCDSDFFRRDLYGNSTWLQSEKINF